MLTDWIYTDYPESVRDCDQRDYNPAKPRVKDILWNHYDWFVEMDELGKPVRQFSTMSREHSYAIPVILATMPSSVLTAVMKIFYSVNATPDSVINAV